MSAQMITTVQQLRDLDPEKVPAVMAPSGNVFMTRHAQVSETRLDRFLFPATPLVPMQDTSEPTADDGYVSRNVYDHDEPEPTADVREALGEFIGNVEWAAQAIEHGGLDHEAATRELEELLASLGYVRIDPEDEAQVETGARSICLAEYRDPDEIGPFGVSDYGERWRGYTARARAVLSALRGGA